MSDSTDNAKNRHESELGREAEARILEIAKAKGSIWGRNYFSHSWRWNSGTTYACINCEAIAYWENKRGPCAAWLADSVNFSKPGSATARTKNPDFCHADLKS